METRNTIFKDAVLSLQSTFPHLEESKLAKDVLENLPSHFDAFGAKVSNSDSKSNIGERALDKACHGFPLHLPGHVQPCREEDKIECNARDQKIRRLEK